VTLKTFSDPIPNLDSFLFWDQAKIKKGSRGGKPKKYYKNFFLKQPSVSVVLYGHHPQKAKGLTIN
jgi:hypothetical protein